MGILGDVRDRLLAKTIERRARDLVSEHLHPALKRLAPLFGIGNADFILKEARSIIPEAITGYSTTYGPLGDIHTPDYDATTLQLIYERHWVVRTCIDKLVREATRKGWRFDPKYQTRCEACDAEYDYTPISEVCRECGGELTEPNAEELTRFNEWVLKCNPDLTFDDILKRAARDVLIFDDFYVSASKATNVAGIELWPEDARYLGIQADKKGRLGGRTFCPNCEATKEPGKETKLYELPAGGPCPTDCGGELVEMAFGQRIGYGVVTAWTKQEMIHGNLWAVGSRLFGTPKLWAVQTQVQAMALIDTYQKDSFDKAKTPKNIFVVKGSDDATLGRFLKQYEKQKELNPMSDMWIPVSAGPAGAVGIEKIPGLESPLIQGSLAFQEFYFKAICYSFGVSPSAIGVETSGRLGGSQEGNEQRDVTPEAIDELQVQESETFQKQLIERFFPEIVSWTFTLRTAHESEEEEEWTIKKLQMETTKLAVEAGFDAIIDETGAPKISGEVDQEQRAQRQREEMEARFGIGGFGEEKETRSTTIEKSVPKSEDRTADLEKISRFQVLVRAGAKEYQRRLDALSETLFSQLKSEFDDVLTPGIPGEDRADIELKSILLERANKALDLGLKDAEAMAIEMGRYLLRLGMNDAAQELARRIQKQEDEAAIEAFRARTISAMRNTLYFGDKNSYLQKIDDLINRAIEENWTVGKLSTELQRELDPDKEHFSRYMWERIARTETASYVMQGRINAYKEFEIPKLRRIVTLDERTDPINCAPFSNAVYKVEDADDVIPAHPSCRCAWAPYYGDEEPLESYQIIRNL